MLALCLVLLGSTAGVDTLHCTVEENCPADSEEFAALFGAGCSLRCAIDWAVTASSELETQAGSSYSASNVDDIDPATAWVEGAEGTGQGEFLEIEFFGAPDGETYAFRALTIQNGYAKSEDVWSADGRIRLLELALNGAPCFVLELEDTLVPQSASWAGTHDIPVGNGDIVTLTIIDAYEGDAREDTAVSGLMLQGAH